LGQSLIVLTRLLTNAIKAISARFDKECNRSLERTVNATEEFSAHELELPLPRFPIEAVTKFELKEKETTGWVEQTSISFGEVKPRLQSGKTRSMLVKHCLRRATANPPGR
jgi:hypothetical protein